MIPETWRQSPIRGDRYEVSNHGRVRNVKTGYIRRPVVDSNGYLAVGMWVGSQSYPAHVHRLVALAFCEGEGPLVRHLDGNPLNNRADNLAFGTSWENSQDMLRHGHSPNANKTHCKNGHPFNEANTYATPRTRNCRRCNAAAVARYKARRTA